MLAFAVTAALAAMPDPSPTPDHTAALEACIEAAAPGRASACIGTVMEPCMDAEPGGETTTGMIACTGRELEIWDARLNAAYAEMMTVLDTAQAARREALRDAQRAWISFRDLECEQQALQFEGGTLARVIHAGCAATMTAERALALEGQLADADL